jgi:hypothetical protein
MLPGQPGTKKLLKKFGKDLICVRYRYDAQKALRYTTIELIVDTKQVKEKKCQSPTPDPDSIVKIKVNYQEEELRKRIKAHGGKWNPVEKVWEVLYKHVAFLEIGDRIVMP